jgi:hypothetical protein
MVNNKPIHMKTNSLPVIAFLAVLAASIVLPVTLGKFAVGLVLAGLVALLVSDYGTEERRFEPVR